MKEFICIVCPNGCVLKVDEQGTISGYTCKRGLKYAEDELTSPKRSVTSTVKTVFKNMPVVSVRTNGEIDKNKIFDLMSMINKIVIDKKMKRGDVVIANLFDSGVDLIITSDMEV